MEAEESLPRLVSNLHGYLRERDFVLASAAGRASAKGKIPLERSLADMAKLFQPGGRVPGHVISQSQEYAIIEVEGGVIGKAVTGTYVL